jgi:hypothetical protein
MRSSGFSIGVTAAHGVVDPFANSGTYISFSGVAAGHPGRTRASLNLIALVLHALFLATEQVWRDHRSTFQSLPIGRGNWSTRR